VAVLSRVAMKEKTRMFLAYVVYLCLFAKGVFCHLPSENAGQFEREKHISFRIALITPACSKKALYATVVGSTTPRNEIYFFFHTDD